MTNITTRLADLCEFQGGSQPPKSKFIYEPNDGYIRFLQIRDFGSEKNHTYIPIDKKNKICTSDDIMIGRYGASVGKILKGRSGAYNVALMKATPDTSRINKEYFWYYLNSPIFQDNLLAVASRSAQDGFSKDDIANFQVQTPPISTQQKIVTKLDAIFAEIEKAFTATETNIKNAEALNSLSVNSVFEEFSSDLIKLSTCSDIGYGYTAKSSAEFEGFQYLRITDIQNDYVDWLSVPKIDKKNEDAKKFLLKDGDIVFARTGATTGKSYLVRNPPSAVFASYLIRVDVKRDMIEPDFLRHFFKSKKYWDSINAGISGAAQGGFNASKLGDLVIPLLDLKDQSRVISRLDEIENYSNTLKTVQFNKLNQLLTLKQSILQQAFNGELVKE